MKKMSLMVLGGIILIALIFLSFSLMMVPEGERGVAVHAPHKILAPGLHLKWPWETFQFIAVNNQISSFAIPLSGSGESAEFAVLWNVQNVEAFVKSGESTGEMTTALQAELSKVLTPEVLATFTSSADLSTFSLQKLNADPLLNEQGIAILAVWVKGIQLNEADQAKVYGNMKGLASSIGTSIVQNAEQQAEAIRNQAEASFLQVQSASLQNAAQILGEGNLAAVKIMAPLYRQNPALFKAYVATKTDLLSRDSNS